MALRAFYFVKTLTYYYINRFERHFLVAIENKRLGGPIQLNICIEFLFLFSKPFQSAAIKFLLKINYNEHRYSIVTFRRNF